LATCVGCLALYGGAVVSGIFIDIRIVSFSSSFSSFFFFSFFLLSFDVSFLLLVLLSSFVLVFLCAVPLSASTITLRFVVREVIYLSFKFHVEARPCGAHARTYRDDR